MSDMEMQEIRRKVIELACRYAGKQNYETEKRNGDFLTGESWGLGAREMVYLYFAVEKEFQVEIKPTELEDYRFATTDGIAEVVSQKISERERK